MSNVGSIEDQKGMIFNVQRYSLHDGPGIRTIVFFKGCPLNCLWCANPESQQRYPEIMIRKTNCIGCGACVRACPEGALALTSDGIEIDRSLCQRCGKCAEVCNSNGITVVGRIVTVQELFDEIIEDKIFFDVSNGGITFSGGEPLMQPEFLKAMLQKCKENNLHAVIETCGQASSNVVEDILPYVDGFYYDIKIMDPEKHKTFTGMTNERILDNLKMITSFGKEVLVRLPLIPGINDEEENIRAIGTFLKSIGITTIQLLPYHAYGVAKYHSIGREYQLDIKSPTEEAMANASALFASYGVTVIA